MQDRLDKLATNASVLTENVKDEDEKNRISANVHSISDQMALIKSWIDEKKQQVFVIFIYNERIIRKIGMINNF